MIRLTTILSEQSKPKVVFVSGLTRYESVAQQTARIQRNMPQYHVVPFKWDQDSAVKQYLENDKPAALILYSKSVEYTQSYSKYISPTKIYAIEPFKQGFSWSWYKWK